MSISARKGRANATNGPWTVQSSEQVPTDWGPSVGGNREKDPSLSGAARMARLAIGSILNLTYSQGICVFEFATIVQWITSSGLESRLLYGVVAVVGAPRPIEAHHGRCLRFKSVRSKTLN